MVAHYYRNVSAVVLVYDVMNETSFNSLSKWVAECNNHGLTPEDVPMIVVGNKLDSGNDARMEVSTYKAQRYEKGEHSNHSIMRILCISKNITIHNFLLHSSVL